MELGHTHTQPCCPYHNLSKTASTAGLTKGYCVVETEMGLGGVPTQTLCILLHPEGAVPSALLFTKLFPLTRNLMNETKPGSKQALLQRCRLQAALVRQASHPGKPDGTAAGCSLCRYHTHPITAAPLLDKGTPRTPRAHSPAAICCLRGHLPRRRFPPRLGPAPLRPAAFPVPALRGGCPVLLPCSPGPAGAASRLRGAFPSGAAASFPLPLFRPGGPGRCGCRSAMRMRGRGRAGDTRGPVSAGGEACPGLAVRGKRSCLCPL